MLDFASVCVCGEETKPCDFIGIREEEHCTFFAAADSKGVSKASEVAVSTMLEDFKEQTEITTATLPDFFNRAQEALCDYQKKTLQHGGCAAAVLLTDGALAVWAHVGDCRIYHLQDRMLYDITPDHSEAYSRYEAGEIRYPKIRTDRKRGRLFRLMGWEQSFEPMFSQPIVVRKNDCFLICTDGFWGNIHERQIEKTLRRSKTAQSWLDRMQKLVEKNRASGKYTKVADDYSAITIRI